MIGSVPDFWLNVGRPLHCWAASLVVQNHIMLAIIFETTGNDI